MIKYNRANYFLLAAVLLSGAAHADTKTVCVIQMAAPKSLELPGATKEDRAMTALLMNLSPQMKLMSGAAMTMTHYHQGEMERFDLSPNNTLVEDHAANRSILIDRSSRTYTVHPLTPLKKKAGHDEDVNNLVSTDKQDTKSIAGHLVKHYVVRDRTDKDTKNTLQFWMDPSAEQEHFLPTYIGDLELLPFEKLAGILSGRCLEMRAVFQDKDGAFSLTYRVSAVSSQPLPSSVFKVPQGFKQVPWEDNSLERPEALLDTMDDPASNLLRAALGGHLDTIQTLLKTNVDVNVTDDYGLTPLVAAIRQHSIFRENAAEIVKLLLDRGAKVDMPVPPDDVTPLMEAADVGDPAVVKILLQRGADAQLKDKNGKTALDHATDQHQVDAIKMLATASNP